MVVQEDTVASDSVLCEARDTGLGVLVRELSEANEVREEMEDAQGEGNDPVTPAPALSSHPVARLLSRDTPASWTSALEAPVGLLPPLEKTMRLPSIRS